MNIYKIEVGNVNPFDRCVTTAKSFEDAYQKAKKFLAKAEAATDKELDMDILTIENEGEIQKL